MDVIGKEGLLSVIIAKDRVTSWDEQTERESRIDSLYLGK